MILDGMRPTINLFGESLLVWALLVGAGVLLCWALLLVRTARLGYRPGLVLLWVMLAFPVGVGGALGLNQAVLALHRSSLVGGMSVLGAILACGLFSLAYIRLVFGEAPWRLLDAVSFTFPLATAFGRVGCLFNGCCFGRIAGPAVPGWLTVPASAYLPPSVAAEYFAGVGPAIRAINLPLLFVLAELVVLLVVEILYRRRDPRLAAGGVFGVAVGLDGLLRLGIEQLRAEPDLGSSASWQLFSTLLAVGGLGFAARRWRGVDGALSPRS